MLEFSGAETTGWVAELERPQEVAYLFEVGSDGEDFMNQIFHTNDAVLAKRFLNDRVVCKRDALFVNLAIPALIDEFTDALEIWIAVSNVWFDNGKHLSRSTGYTNENPAVDL